MGCQKILFRQTASREFIEHLSNELGHDPDIEMYQQLYRPPIAHDLLPDGDEYNVHRIQIDGVVVRYVVGVSNIQVIVEGQLPEDILATIQADVRTKFGLLENIDPLMETFFSP